MPRDEETLDLNELGRLLAAQVKKSVPDAPAAVVTKVVEAVAPVVVKAAAAPSTTINTTTLAGIAAASGTPATSTAARLDAATAANAKNAADTIAALKNLGVGGATTTDTSTSTKTNTATSTATATTPNAGKTPAVGTTVKQSEVDAYLANKPTKKANESNAEYMARLTQWYKDQPHSGLTKEQADAGATLEWVRTGPSGEGEYKVVYPIGVQFDKATGKPIIDPNTGKAVNVFTPSPTPTPTPTPTSMPIPSGLDPVTQAFIQSLQDQITSLTAATNKSAADAATIAATAAAEKKAAEAVAAADLAAQREAAGKVLQDRFSKFGLSGLANKIMDLARSGATESTITLELEKTNEYQMRFKANAERIKKGLAVLTPAEYISNEDGYRQTLRAYGLTQFDNDQYVSQFIANDVSPQELSSRVSIAVQRVQNADPTVTKTLRDFYGIGQTDMVAYILDPNQTLPKIQQQVAAAEIGSAARMQGLEAGVSVSEQLARQGISQAEAQKGYATIADILPSAERLSQIYGGTVGTYGQSEAEQEVFNSLASAQRKRRALVGRETATFSGAAGTGRGSLGSSSTGTF